MTQLVVLNLGQGDWAQGFPSVTAQLWQSDAVVPMQFTGALPAAPELVSGYQRWQRLYEALYAHLHSRRINPEVVESEFEIDEDDITNISKPEFDACGLELQQQLNQWLNHREFHPIDRKLRTQLVPSDEIRLIITAGSPSVLQFPWCLWSFFEDFPKAELALSPTNYSRVNKTVQPIDRPKVKILAILGDSCGIDVDRDRALLEQLPHAEIQVLVEPTRSQLSEQLWVAGWDILFFAGHSSSQGQGEIQINPTTTLTIEQLKYGLREAIAQGLKLAIFNSCDGLGLARDLAELQIPQVIVMREPVPDRVAQNFLTHFLAAFSQGKSLYLSVREAREKLQDMETEFPGAPLLPVICQNPAEVSQIWQDWYLQPKSKLAFPNRRDWKKLIFSSTIATGVVLGVRALGLLQPMEIWGLDQGIRLRSPSIPDSRLLIVTITEEDIQRQRNEPRKGSLSDRTLHALLSKLEQYEAATIGLDVYRDFPVEANRPELAKLMKTSDRLIAICKRPDPVYDPMGIEPPPEMRRDRLGFSDFVEDSDGVLRRQLLLMSPNPISPCATHQSFAVKLAFQYLNQKGIQAGFTETGNLKFGDRIYPRLTARSSGYQTIDAGGTQLLLNYRSHPRNIASQVTVSQILDGQINPNAIKDRIVLIGVTSNSSGDYWATPYGRGFSDRVPGVFLQAQMVSQLVSAGFNQRSLLNVVNLGFEFIWIEFWAMVAGFLLFYFRRRSQIIIVIIGLVGTVTGFCFILLISGWWLPWVPTLLACVITQGPMRSRLDRFSKPLILLGSTS
jgi:CHASE2 domain-containing sensor protein